MIEKCWVLFLVPPNLIKSSKICSRSTQLIIKHLRHDALQVGLNKHSLGSKPKTCGIVCESANKFKVSN